MEEFIRSDGEDKPQGVEVIDRVVDALSIKNRPFTIVGMGGSAGSFTAIQEFLQAIPEDSGIAFVLVQHLDPSQPSLLPELLQRSSPIPVLRVEDGMEVKPNHLYVIPENKEMAILNGKLLLMHPVKPRGKRMPIDNFLQSLAADWGEKAVCAIFSGMGSDGETGARFIKEGFGMVMVQSPDSAQYDSMPRSIIETDNPDYVDTPLTMAHKLLSYEKYPSSRMTQKDTLSRKETTALQKIFVLLRNRTGHDFSLYKKNTIIRRFGRRMHTLQLQSQDEYFHYLQENPKEVESLFKELLIGVTKFFRDFEAFRALEEKVFPELLKRKGKNDAVRIWVAGCSTGEEVYSLAICLEECMEKLKLRRRVKVQIFATDLDPEAIRKARAGVYMGNVANDISAERLQRWFIQKGDSYQVSQEIREMIVFAEHNMIKDASFTNLDLLCCRNVLIYFAPELQKRLLPVFHYTLNADGVLFLGPSENISGLDNLFAPIDGKWKIFRKRENAAFNRFIEFPAQTTPQPKLPIVNTELRLPITNRHRSPTLPEKTQKILLERHTPPAVVINAKGDALYIHGRTGNYMEPAPGQFNTSIYDMARPGLALELRGAVLRASAQKEKVVVNNVKVEINDHLQLTKITVEPITDTDEFTGLLLITFEDQPMLKPSAKKRSKVAITAEKDSVVEQLEQDLNFTREHLQQTIEQMQTTVEELKSANEELQSTNEELQSTNEESNTAKEEMQAINEELLTVNMEVRAKAEELTELNNDIANLLNSSQVATIFLSNSLRIKRFTPSATRIMHLMQNDVGRPITDINSNLLYKDLARDVKEVIEKLLPKEIEVASELGQWYLLRILPYRTLDNFIGGAILTLMDITHFKQLEAQLQHALRFAENILDSARDPMVVLDKDLRIISVNKTFLNTFKVAGEQTKGQRFYSLGNGQWDIPELRKLINEVMTTNQEFNDFIVTHEFPSVGFKRMKLHARQLIDGQLDAPKILLTIEELTQEPGTGEEV